MVVKWGGGQTNPTTKYARKRPDHVKSLAHMKISDEYVKEFEFCFSWDSTVALKVGKHTLFSNSVKD